MNARSVIIAASISVAIFTTSAYVLYRSLRPETQGRSDDDSGAPASGRERDDGSANARRVGGEDPRTAGGRTAGKGLDSRRTSSPRRDHPASRSAPRTTTEASLHERGGDNAQRGRTDASGTSADAGSGALLFTLEDRSGHGVPGVTVRLKSGRHNFEMKADANGLAEFDEIPASSYVVSVDAAGYPPQRAGRQVRVTDNNTTEILVVLDTLQSAITGKVLDTDGQPVAGIEVRANLLQKGRGELTLQRDAAAERVVTDDWGLFSFSGLAEGDYNLETVETGDRLAVRKSVVAPATDVQLVVHGQRAIAITGDVLDTDGNPVPDVRISTAAVPGSADTDGSGSYRLEINHADTPGARLILMARKKGYSSPQEIISLDTASDENEIKVSFEIEPIEDPASLAGRVVDPDGKPAAGQLIGVHSASHNTKHDATTDANGDFSITDIAAGKDYRLWVYPRRDYRDRTIYPLVIDPGENDIEIVLERLERGILDGTLQDAVGSPLPRFTVILRSSHSLSNSITVTSDPSGHFRAEDVPTGPLVVVTRAFPRVDVRGLTITAGEELTVTIPVGVGDRSVTGEVIDAAGGAVPGARVHVSWSTTQAPLRSQLSEDTVTDEHGAFTVSGFGPGECSAIVSATGYRPTRLSFKITAAGEPAALTVQLQLLDREGG